MTATARDTTEHSTLRELLDDPSTPRVELFAADPDHDCCECGQPAVWFAVAAGSPGAYQGLDAYCDACADELDTEE